MDHFGEFSKTWILLSNSVTRQDNFNRTKIVWKCQNWNETFWLIFKQCDVSFVSIFWSKSVTRHVNFNRTKIGGNISSNVTFWAIFATKNVFGQNLVFGTVCAEEGKRFTLLLLSPSLPSNCISRPCHYSDDDTLISFTLLGKPADKKTCSQHFFIQLLHKSLTL